MAPSPRSRRCTRIFRLAIATNITFNRPGVVVALVLKPNSSLNDSMAVTWLSPGSTSWCTSLAILWQSALVSGGTSNDAPFSISWFVVIGEGKKLSDIQEDFRWHIGNCLPGPEYIVYKAVHILVGLNLYRVWRCRDDERFCFGAHFVLLLLLQPEEFTCVRCLLCRVLRDSFSFCSRHSTVGLFTKVPLNKGFHVLHPHFEVFIGF